MVFSGWNNSNKDLSSSTFLDSQAFIWFLKTCTYNFKINCSSMLNFYFAFVIYLSLSRHQSCNTSYRIFFFLYNWPHKYNFFEFGTMSTTFLRFLHNLSFSVSAQPGYGAYILTILHTSSPTNNCMFTKLSTCLSVWHISFLRSFPNIVHTV